MWPAVSKVPREAHFVIPVAQVVFSGVGLVRRPSLRTGCPSPASQRREGSPPFPREPRSWSARAPRERRGPPPSPPGKGGLECRVRPGKDSLFHTVETSAPRRQRSPAKVLSFQPRPSGRNRSRRGTRVWGPRSAGSASATLRRRRACGKGAVRPRKRAGCGAGHGAARAWAQRTGTKAAAARGPALRASGGPPQVLTACPSRSGSRTCTDTASPSGSF